jgi:hypothetical protein
MSIDTQQYDVMPGLKREVSAKDGMLQPWASGAQADTVLAQPSVPRSSSAESSTNEATKSALTQCGQELFEAAARQEIIELMSEAATRSLLEISVYQTINVSNIGHGHVAEFELDDHREALRFIVLWGQKTALRLAGKDRHGNLIYYVIPYRDETYGFVGQLDEVEAFVNAQRENHRGCCADCSALHHGSPET